MRLTIEDAEDESKEEESEEKEEEEEEEESILPGSSESMAFSDLCKITGIDPKNNKNEDNKKARQRLQQYMIDNEIQKKKGKRKKETRTERIRTMFSFSNGMYGLLVRTSLYLLFLSIMVGGAATAFYHLWTLETDEHELEISLWITFLFSVLNYGSKPYEPFIEINRDKKEEKTKPEKRKQKRKIKKERKRKKEKKNKKQRQ